MSDRMVIERHNNKEVLTIHVTTRLIKGKFSVWDYDGLVETERLTPTGKIIADGMLLISGLVRISICKYSISIHKGEAFSWGAIKPEILRMLKPSMGADTAVEYKDSRTAEYRERA